MAPLLRLWEYDPEGTYTSWTVLSSSGTDAPERPLVREVVWKRRHDERHRSSADRRHKLRTKPQSTIQVRDADVLTRDLRPFTEDAARLFVPAIPPDNPDVQMESYGIEGYRSLAYLRMEWRGSGPVEWTETIRWVTRLRELLTASLKEREEVEG